jgi:hypothetical protein
MNLSGNRSDNIKALVTPTASSTTSLGLSNNDNLPISYGSETDPVFISWLASPTGLTKTHVGLANVDNTADTSKPISTLVQAALDLKQTLANLHTTALTASATKYPSCTSVKNYVDAVTSGLSVYELLANKSTNVTTDGASDTKYPSCKAVKTYVDARISGSISHNDTTGKQASGGATEWYHLTQSQHGKLIQAASSITDGYLTKEDWAVFNSGSGGVASSLVTSNFSIEEVTNRLVIKYGNTEIFSISTAGAIKVKDEITGYTTP